MKLNHSQASRVVGVSRKTFYTHVDQKNISKELDDKGQPLYDLSELMRVYPHLAKKDEAAIRRMAVDTNQKPTPQGTGEKELLEQEIRHLKEKLEVEQERRERAERQEEESRELIKLLHRQLPPPAEVAEARTAVPEPAPRRKFLGLF